VVPVALPLLGAAALMAVQHFLPRRVGMWTAIAIVGIAAVACGLLLDASWFHPIQYWMGGWAPRNGFALGIEFAIDPMGACTATLVAVLGIAALVFSEKYFDTVGMLYPALMLIFIGAMCGFSLTGDLFNLFVFFELMSVSAFALCAYKTEDPGTVEGAWNFAVVNSVGAFLIMIGIAFIYARTSALNMAQIGAILRGNAPDALVVAAFTFIAGGLMIKAAQVPFHFWLADAHSVAPTPVCVLFSGVMVELALYGIARVYWTMFSGAMTPRPGLRATLIVFAGATALLGAFMSFTQRNLKRMLAFSTISHSGMIALGIALLSVKGLAGAAIYTLGHGATKGSLFLAAGIILHRLGDLDEFELHGKGRPLWMAALILVIGAAGLSGIPPSGIHRGDVLIRDAARDLDLRWLDVFSVTSCVLTAAAVFRYVGRVFFGWGSSQPLAGPPPTPEASETKGAHNRTPTVMWVPGLLLALAGISIGVIPNLIARTGEAAARFEAEPASTLQNLPVFPDALHGFSTLAASIAVALLAIFSVRLRRALASVGRGPALLQRLHNGHVGDYTAWLTLGIAALGAGLLAVFHAFR
jgi:multicomponent Na+:H+ antiporter subunit D